MQNGATFVRLSRNDKLGDAAATYASIHASCPPTCKLRGSGCYAEDGNVGFTVRRLDREVEAGDWRTTAKAEAAAIDAGTPIRGLPLRLHVSGDCRNATAARIVSGAAERYMARGGGQAWTYTHAWRTVDRAAWGNVSVLASMENTKQGRKALQYGYAPAVVVRAFDGHIKHGKIRDDRAFDRDGVRWTPCPAQTRGVKCSDCRLCLNAAGLVARKAGIAFEPDGNTAKRVLKVLAA